MRYKLVYTDGYSEVLDEGEFILCEKLSEVNTIRGSKYERRLINWNNVISIVPAKPYEGVIDKGQNA